ncbi:MAG: 50S ribosomal protein L19e [Candidatus Odinarchaeota archaeon]|nr:50S ribosomal protein L19e [Candidatus Odinarchaeota archaeon]
MSLRVQRKLAARIYNVGVERIWIDPDREDEVSLAVRREEIKKLVHDGAIRIKPIKGTSRARARILHEKKKKGRRRGHGSRKGKKTARLSRKEMWIIKVRTLRRYLRQLRDENVIDARTYRILYLKASSGVFHSLRHMKMYMEDNELIPRRQK